MTDNVRDYAARDDSIRCLTYTSVRRREGIPHRLFDNYWRDVHGPLCARLPGLGFYVQHHFSRAHSANLWRLAEGVLPMNVVLDGAVEIGFSNISDQARFKAASPVLFGDEFNFLGHVIAYNLPQGSRTLVDRQVDATPNGPDRLHRLHLYLNGGSDEGFRTWVSGFANELATAPAVQKLRLHLPEPYSNDNPQPPSPRVDHHVDDDRKDLAIVEIGFETSLSAARFFESNEFQATVEGQAAHLRSMAVFLVTGVYTYIRDGVLTTAGLRGSRPAELIEKLGALNQTSEDVSNLFTPDPKI
jgi:hypothetical protein